MFSGKLILRERAYVEVKDLHVNSFKVFLSVDHLENLFPPQKVLGSQFQDGWISSSQAELTWISDN